MVYKVTDQIPLSYIKIDEGSSISGLSPTVKVQNEKTGDTLLTETALTEVSTGLYSLTWTHGRTTQTFCVATYTDGSQEFKDYFVIDDLAERIDAVDGRAV